MMYGIDKDRLHLFLGLTHPLYGPMNLAAYTTALSLTMGTSLYTAWVKALVDTTYPDRTGTDKPRNPA